MPFVKLDCGILDSSLWVEDLETRVVFITMLAMAEPSGLVRATAPGIARRANVMLDDVRRSLEKLEAPDPDSRTLAEEGRRIRRVDGGYEIVNYEQYRRRDATAAERMRRYRKARKERNVTRNEDEELRASRRNGVTNVTIAEAEAEAEAEASADAEADLSVSPDGDTRENSAEKIPYQAIVDLYHEVLPELPRVVKLTGTRRQHIRARWRSGDLPTLDDWREYFKMVRESRFLMGAGRSRDGGRPFRADLDWLIREGNAVKVAEGRYT